jgi:multidrug resistance efflux pump
VKPTRLIPVAVILGLAVGGYFLDRSRSAKRSTLTGTFESQPSRLAPKTTGRVAQIEVTEGQAVTAGQLLVRLSAPDTELDAVALREQARQAEAKSNETQAGNRKEEIARQQAVVREAEAGLGKALAGPLPEEIRAAADRVDSARARYLQLRRGSRIEQVQAAKAAASEAKARLDIVRRGPNPEERRQLEARLRSAASDLHLAALEYERKKRLYEEGAIAGRDADVARNRYETAAANRDAAALALQRAREGAPPEERRQAEASYRQALARLSEVQAGPRREEIAAAAAELRVAEDNLKLIRRGTRSEDVVAARARLDAAKASLAQLQAGARSEEVAQARAGARAAQAQAGSATKRLEELTVRAPKAGVVERILVAQGDLASATIPVVQFSDPTDIWLRVYVPETSLGSIRPGSAAVLSVDGIPGAVEAVVESVSTQGEFTPANLQTPEERGKQVFAVRLRLKRPDPRIKAGMAATVTRLGSGG